VTAATGATGSPLISAPEDVRRIAARLTEAGFETWCVGGAVRDALLGEVDTDWDLATAATPNQVRSLFTRTVPHGIEFGTVGVLDRKGIMHEVTTFRRDVKHDGRHAVVEFGVSIDEDLARRDFTINAIAYSPSTDEIRDPFGGRADLERRIVRAVGDPSARMLEDRLRALRAFRFAGRFGFEIDQVTWGAIVESAPFLPRLSRERVRQEIEKTLNQVRRPSRSFALWRRSQAFMSLIPELASVPEEAFAAADFIGMPDATRRPELAQARGRNRLATLFLDLTPGVARSTLAGLRASNRDTDWVTHHVDRWTQLGGSIRQSMEKSYVPDAVLRRWAAIIGRTYFADFVRVAAARWSAESGSGEMAGIASVYRRGTRIAFREPLSVGDLTIDGNDLMELGIPAGPAIGETLRRLLEVVIDDPAKNDRDTLLHLARATGGEAPR
jgi:tRNA nucleotidyltransferase (CCA-adding enzyme)